MASASPRHSMSRTPRRCQKVMEALVPKICVACKLATGKDQKPPDPFHCREVLGHVLPNWDAPGADRYFEDAKTSPADVLAMAAAEAVVPVRAPPKKKRPRSPGPGSPPPRHRIKAPTGPRPTGAMSDLKQGPTRAAAPAPRGDFGLKKPLVFGVVEKLAADDPATPLRAKELRRGGVPCVLTGVAAADVAPCMSDWVKPDGSLNDAALLRDVGDERAPILRYDAAYSDAAPIREAMRVADFVKDHWATGDASAYLHQWQFPLSETARRTLLPRGAEKPPPLPGLDRDLLEHWLERTGGHSALQYVFMGGKGTHSRLHVDPGGLDLVIAPLIGTKEVTLVHRDDAELVGAMCDSDDDDDDPHAASRPVDPEACFDARTDDGEPKRKRLDALLAAPTPPSLEEEPLLALVRCWRHDLKPGEALVMPEGTLHAVRNSTPALSFHRFHLDTTNPAGFWKALVDGDSPGIRPAEILWNGTHGAMRALDEAVDGGDGDAARDRAECLLKLRHLVGAIVREFDPEDLAVLGRRAGSEGRRGGFDWRGLLEDVDDTLGYWAAGGDADAPRPPRGGQGKRSQNRACEPDADDAAPAADYEPRPGDVVAAKFHAKQVRARIVDVAAPAAPRAAPRFVRVHYDTYSAKYDELVESEKVQPRDGEARVALVAGARCKVPWGEKKDAYDAEIVSLHPAAAYRLHYLTIGGDWDQWVGRRRIIRKLRG